MKKRKLWLHLGTAFSLAGCLSSCQVVSHLSSSEDLAGDAELSAIMAKYDASLYQYDGEECSISMAHWDSTGAKIERAVVEAVLKGFQKRYPTIKVNLEIIQNYDDVYGNYLSAGTAHDVFLLPDGDISGWAPSGKILNLSPFIASSTLLSGYQSDVFESVLSRYQYNPTTGRMGSGNQMALPKDVGPYVMYYNKDWFDQKKVAYPPNDRIMSIDEATTMWKALNRVDESGRITGYGVGNLLPEGLVWSAGGDFLNPERTAFPTDTATLAGLRRGYQYLKDAHLNYQILPSAEFAGITNLATLFSQQKIATLVSGRWEVASYRNLSFNWDIAFVPSFEVNPTKNMYSGSVGYGVNAKSSHLEAAWKVVEYIASKEGQEILSSTGFQIPTYKTLANNPDFIASESKKRPANYQAFVTSAEKQGYGLWQYRSNNLWKVNGYDIPSEFLYSTNPQTEITVDQFLALAKEKVNANIY